MLLKHFSNIALLGFAIGLSSLASAETVVGKAAPAFTTVAADGTSVSLSAYKGKTVVLEWTNNECPFVKKHYESGNIPSLQKEATGKGVVWLQVISSAPGNQGYIDGKTAIKVNADRHATPTNTLLDPEGKLGKLYEAQTTPHFFIVNPEGVLVYKGGIDSIPSAKKEDIAKAQNYVKTALDELSAGKSVTTANTKPYGCSVKYAS